MEKLSDEVTNLGASGEYTPWPDDLEASLLSFMPRPPPSPRASGKGSPGGRSLAMKGAAGAAARPSRLPPSLPRAD